MPPISPNLGLHFNEQLNSTKQLGRSYKQRLPFFCPFLVLFLRAIAKAAPMNSPFVFFFFFCLPTLAIAQLPSKYSIPLRLNMGATLTNIDHEKGTLLSQLPGPAIELESGIDMRLNDFWWCGLGLRTGAIAYNFTFKGNYGITYLLYPRFETHLTRRFIVEKNKHSDAYFRMSYGLTWHDGSSKMNSESEFDVRTQVARTWVPHISPEIGLVKHQKDDQIQLGLTYNYSFSNTPLIEFDFSDRAALPNRSKASSNLNFLAIVVRYNFGLKEYKNDGSKASYAHRQEAENRETRERKEVFNFSQSRVVLELSDNAQVDGDSISVRFNGQWILMGTPIDNSKKKVVLYLNKGSNELLVFANNEGRIPPNTVKVRLISGFRRKSLTISTSLDRNEAVELFLR